MILFHNRKLLIATKHQKEKVIAPILEKELGISCFVDQTYDTDIMGTFTGEVERKLDPIATAREKCLKAMHLNKCDLGVASEGSFGSHPSLFFVNAGDEFLIFIDLLNNLEIIVRELSTKTNFDGKTIKNRNELFEFAKSVGFPTHALILRKSKDDTTEIYKGIKNIKVLKATFDQLQKLHNSVFVETDMRAMNNPTRLGVIKKAAEKLVQKIKSTCPQCQTPGFGRINANKGLECSLCGLPTNSILSYTYVCQNCSYSKEEMYPFKKLKEDPMYCDYCNP